MTMDRLKYLETEVARLKTANNRTLRRAWFEWFWRMKLQAGIDAVKNLIEESSGVTGLHLNGAVAEWSSLRTGGAFEEWLLRFDDALDSPPFSTKNKEISNDTGT